MTGKSDRNMTKERIQECAMELFRKNGFNDVTVVQICEAAGITKRTFYYHYDSKNQLLYGLTDYLGEKAESLLDTLALQQTNVGMLWTLMSVYSINSAQYGAEIIRQLYIHTLSETNENFPYSTYLYNTAVKTIENAKATGEIKNPSAPQDIAFALYHCFRSVTVTWASQNGKTNLVEEFRRVFAAILGIDANSF